MKKKSMDLASIKSLGYLGIFILLIFIILPPLFRLLFPVEDVKQVEKDKLIMNLSCIKTENFVEYELTTKINTNYVEGQISDSTFTYEIVINDDMFMASGVDISEYEALKKVSNVDFEEEKNKYILKINYSKFDYTNEPLLEKHRQSLSAQMKIYSEEEQFECTTSKVQ